MNNNIVNVNMTPNSFDVGVLNCSQGDTEARKFKFNLLNGKTPIDLSNIVDSPLPPYKVYKGGTEQILPINTSTPTTSPFLGDIRYPDGLRTDQYFTYRECPTEEDGQAKIKSIKGNSIVWNQLALLRSTFTSVTKNGVTLTKNGDSFTLSGTATSETTFVNTDNYMTTYSFEPGHKYYVAINQSSISGVTFGVQGYGYPFNQPTISVIRPASESTNWNGVIQIKIASGTAVNKTLNIQIVDITKLGLGDITVNRFRELFPLPYYAYNSGTLLSFNGTGIKTVGKNQFDTDKMTISTTGVTIEKSEGKFRLIYAGGTRYTTVNYYSVPLFTDTFLKGKYRLSFDVEGLDVQWSIGMRTGATFVATQTTAPTTDGHYSVLLDTEASPNSYISFCRTGNSTGAYDITFSNIMLEYGVTETEYVPYVENTTSLPISTYFPTGLKSAGNVYDELTESKSITRIGAVDLGTLTCGRNAQNGYFYFGTGSGTTSQQNVLLPRHTKALSWSNFVATDKTYIGDENGTRYVFIHDDSYTDANAFKTAMSGVYLFYELNTYTETSISTATLVSNKGEIPLSVDNGVLVGECVSDFSEKAGTFDAKVKVIGDGVVYSNKVQIHVERRPE